MRPPRPRCGLARTAPSRRERQRPSIANEGNDDSGNQRIVLAVGAVLVLALDRSMNGVEVNTIGVILIVVGAIGMLVGLAATRRHRSDPTVGP